MSYQEKRTITTILSGAAILAAYCIYAFGKVQSGAAQASNLKFWASTMLIFIGIGIVATIVIQIVFHILLSIGIAVQEKIRNQESTDEKIEKTIKAEMVEDERDKLIELKGSKFGYALTGFGFVAGLVTLVLDYPPAVMMNLVFISASAGSLLEGFAQLYFYRKGV